MENISSWWRKLTPQQKARYTSRAIVSTGMFAIGTRVKGPVAGAVLAGGGYVVHEMLDAPLAMILLSLGLF